MDSPLEGAGFEPSVPREGSYALETAPFDRDGISFRPQGADSFAVFAGRASPGARSA
jgi:hypothetical protein